MPNKPPKIEVDEVYEVDGAGLLEIRFSGLATHVTTIEQAETLAIDIQRRVSKWRWEKRSR